MNNPFSQFAPRQVREQAHIIVWVLVILLAIVLVVFNPKVFAAIVLGLITLGVGTVVFYSLYGVIRYMVYGDKK